MQTVLEFQAGPLERHRRLVADDVEHVDLVVLELAAGARAEAEGPDQAAVGHHRVADEHAQAGLAQLAERGLVVGLAVADDQLLAQLGDGAGDALPEREPLRRGRARPGEFSPGACYR